MKYFSSLAFVVLLPWLVGGQTASVTQPSTTLASPANATSNEVGILLTRIEQETQGLNADIGKLRTDKWKADSSVKQEASENAASIQRNITAALPEMIGAVRSAPQSLATNFKLYRNLNALYDVTASLAESTGAFGKREEYATISPHVVALDDDRRLYADLLQTMSANADNTIVAAQKAQAAATAAAQTPSKKVIVDDAEPATAAKSTAKKKKTKKSSASSSSSGTSTPQ